jgi:L-alanine-DL-glutamate epimerase-like enolase superfamily enzyme
MKITRVEPILVALPYEHGAPKPARTGMGTWETQDILFVRVDTDAGITGWGEAFSNASTPVTIPAVSEVIAKLAVGRDPSDIEALMFDLTRRTQSMARSGPVSFALSGLDIALWDIAGKIAGEPLWRLFGGTAKVTVPAYASLFRLGTRDHVMRVTRRAVERGYRHIKLHEHTIEAVAAARAAAGPDVALMVDTNCFWTSPEDVVSFCERLAPYDVTWLEEPLYPADAYDVMARIRDNVRVPLAAGENLGNYNDVRWIVDARGVDIVQPSVAKMGGITELRRALAHAASRNMRAVPHSPYVGPALVAAIHVIAAMPQEVACEHRFCDLAASPLGDCVVSRDGALAVPQGPGLGFDIDQAVIDKYRVR